MVLTETEQATYKRVHGIAAEYFSRYESRGPHCVSKNLLHIMSLLLPMRRICSGGALTERDLALPEPDLNSIPEAPAGGSGGGGGSGGSASITVDESLVAPEEECPICMDAYEEPTVTTCNHWFCKGCIVGALQQVNYRCPLCRNVQRQNQLRGGITAADAAEREAERKAELGVVDVAAEAAAAAAAARVAEQEAAIAATAGRGVISESKLAALLKSLRDMRRQDPSAKALIFSQYNSTIEWLKIRLTREGFGHRHISGSMPLKQRAKAIQAFQGDPPTTVFLLSMRSGAVGINLTAASHVFLLEPALNPALEEQAIGRAWRMGQQREVKVLRFFVKGSVEEQIMEVVKARQGNVAGGSAAALAASDEDHPRARFNNRHIRVEDQAGSIKEDKQNLRLSELQILFKTPEFPPPRENESLSDDEDAEYMAVRRGTMGALRRGHTSSTLVRPGSATGGSAQRQIGGGYDNDDDDDNLPGTSAMHAAMGMSSGAPGSGGGNGVHLPAAVAKARMRRSRAGIAAMAGAANTPGRVGATAIHGAGAGPTPAATLAAPPTVAGRHTSTQQAQQSKEDEIMQEEQEEEILEDPIVILQRLKALNQKSTGRLTPVTSNGQDKDATAGEATTSGATADGSAAAGPASKRQRGRPLSRAALEAAAQAEAAGGGGGGRSGDKSIGVVRDSAAVAAHIPRPTPDTEGSSDLNSGRGSRSRAPRRNYAKMEQLDIDIDDL